jgi:hypothetical protein
MKKLLSLVSVFLLILALSGCMPENYDYSDELEGIREDIQTIEIIEVPTVVTETEIQIVEVPTIITETEVVEIEVPVEIETEVYQENVTTFVSGDGETVIINGTYGYDTYIFEIIYKDPTIGKPYMELVQLEYQYMGTVINSYFFEDVYEEETQYKYELENMDEFLTLVQELTLLSFDELETMYSNMGDVVSNVTLEVDEVIELGEEYTVTLDLDENYTYVFQLDVENYLDVIIDVTTSNEFDINIYNNTLVANDYEYWLDIASGTTTQSYSVAYRGTYYFELENYHDAQNLEITITFSIDDQTA